MTDKPVHIQHFSDILCVWAYVSQIRMDELQKTFSSDVEIELCFFQVFGDVPGKMAAQWSARGGIQAYADHVGEVAGQFEHAELNPDVWRNVVPVSSMPAHLLLCGVRLLDVSRVAEVARQLRHAFFVAAKDISSRSVLLAVAEASGINVAELEKVLDCGEAHAELSSDLSRARAKDVVSSPTLVFNEDRQRLVGNVGYRVLEANVRELLRSPADQQSWC